GAGEGAPLTGGRWSSSHRQTDDGVGAPARPGRQLDLAPVGGDEPADDRQPEAGAAEPLAVGRGVALSPEPIERPHPGFGTQPGTTVEDVELDPAGSRATGQGQLDPAARRRGVDGVGQQVVEDLDETV